MIKEITVSRIENKMRRYILEGITTLLMVAVFWAWAIVFLSL